MAESSKHAILSALRNRLLQAADLPSLDGDWIVYDDVVEQFSQSLASVGGNAVRIHDRDQLNDELEKLPPYQDATKIASTVPGIRRQNVDISDFDDPHDLQEVDYFIAAGEFAVAENGAIWVTDHAVKHRVAYFLAQHLALIVPAGEIVSNMHQAYERLGFSEPGFGVFISGPSKTADIEQSLVIGAHGARSLTVFITPDPIAPA